MYNIKAIFLILGATYLVSLNANALQIEKYDNVLIAQAEDSFDPFADYSEFEETRDEEADINFFKNGRFFTLGFIGGQRDFTSKLKEITTPSPTFGVYFSYFFDLRFSLQFTFITGQHKYNFTTPANEKITSSSTLTSYGLSVKYYFNTQNVTKGLASLNPYLISGFSQVTRTASSSSSLDVAKEGAMGFTIGGGLEVPLLRNSMFAGFQAAYHLVNFKNEQTEIEINGNLTGIYPTGDVISLLGIIGVNF